VAIRNIRRDTRKELESAEKDNQLTADELSRAEKDLDRMTQACEATVDGALATKEEELLEV
ncbi:MAG: ribosome recycling factor, partial [Acidimicrobiia bacterium]|nr:ribosome recycling factor [Acidimicrobiia bacterium]